MEKNKFKTFIKNNFLYFIIAFACLAYIAYGLVKIETSGKTIIEIIGQGAVIFFVSYLICRLFSMQGLLSGDRKDEVIKTTEIPTVLTPLERALANRRKTANKYDSYISSKLLPGLSK